MAKQRAFGIDFKRKFPHLRNAPIVEAVIEFKARAGTPWDEENVTRALDGAMQEYSKPEGLYGGSLRLSVRHDPAGVSGVSRSAIDQESGWIGLRFKSADGLQIAHFTRDGFLFTRLKPYLDWSQLSTEAIRLWEVHARIAGITRIQRIGVRFINRIEVPAGPLNLDRYFRGFSVAPADLPLSEFLHRDVLSVPRHPYRIIMIRTAQPLAGRDGAALIVDIDAFDESPVQPQSDVLARKLADLRWLKNYAFAEAVTPGVIKQCR